MLNRLIQGTCATDTPTNPVNLMVNMARVSSIRRKVTRRAHGIHRRVLNGFVAFQFDINGFLSQTSILKYVALGF